MNEKYIDIRKRFKQIITEKNNEKEKRNKSFIQSHKKYLEDSSDNNSDNSYLNLTKISFFLKNEKEGNNKNNILDKKYNLLKKSIEKLQFIIEKNIKTEKVSTNNILKNINQIKNIYINELLKEQNSMESDLNMIKEKYMKKIDNNEMNIMDGGIKDFMNNNMKDINNTIDKINIFANQQNNLFNNINSDINEQFNNINIIYEKEIQRKNKIDESLDKINNKINIFEKKENIKREKFKEDIFNILNTELNKLNKIDMSQSYSYE